MKPSALKVSVLLCALGPQLGCVKPRAVPRLAQPQTIAAVYVLDEAGSEHVATLPAALPRAVATILAPRNLRVELLRDQSVRGKFGAVRDSAQRVQLLRPIAASAPALILIESEAYYSAQLGGRYRWNVALKVTVADPDGRDDPLTQQFNIPAVLLFAHEGRRDAIAAVADQLARRVAEVVDRYYGAQWAHP